MNPEKFLEHFSNHLKNAIARGISVAGRHRHEEVAPIHLLYALAEEPGALAGDIIKRHALTSQDILVDIQTRGRAGGPTTVLPELNAQAKRALEKAMLAAYEHGEHRVGTEHLLFGILAIEDPLVAALFRRISIDENAIIDDVEDLMHKNAAEDELAGMQQAIEHFYGLNAKKTNGAKNAKKETQPRPPSALDVFTVNLTAKQAQAVIDPVIGRDKELERLTRILSRRTKNNPVLVGEPGVGKTALVEGLAKKIAAGDVPDLLKKKKILSLDLPLLVAGTMYRGEFEARLKQVIEDIAARNDVILFIDEIHTIIGAGSNQGTLDAANMLKPALARGLLHCIGATTINEYQKHIADDPALERRFQSIHVEEPSPEETVAIIQGIKPYYEKFHGVAIHNDAIEGAVALSVKYIHDNFLPDKAIDLIDEASAAVRLKQATGKKTKSSTAVTRADIAGIVSTRFPLPSEWLLMNDWEHLDRVEAELKQTIVGQDTVIERLIHALRQAHLGLSTQTDKPLASFLFTGPSGVGKTALAKALAHALYRDKKALVRLDMTEFTEAHSVAKLLGSPAGYVGYKERNHTLDELRRRPYAVLVFDEFDKAHPDVQKILFQILDEGTLRASDGTVVHLKHTIVILTANIGEELYRSPHFGFGATTDTGKETAIREKIKEHLGSSLASRINQTLIFQPLQPSDLVRITERAFHEVAKQLKQHHQISLAPDASVIRALTDEALLPSMGTRRIPQLVGNVIHDCAVKILQNKKKKKKQYTITQKNGVFALQ